MSEPGFQTPREIAASQIGPLGKSNTPYLGVAHRLAWLRAEHPQAAITADLLSEHEFIVEFWDQKRGESRVINSRRAIFRCQITLPNGAQAVGHGSETAQDFADYLEKAETKARGRALEALGYSLDSLMNDDPELATTTRRESGGAGPERGAGDPNSWTAFWKWAREEQKLNSREAIEQLIGRQMNNLQPSEVRDLIAKARAANQPTPTKP